MTNGTGGTAKWQDTTTISKFTPRDFFVSVATNSTMVNCGTREKNNGAAMTCDLFDVTWYNNTRLNVPSTVLNRGGMASTALNAQGKAYFTGGSTSADQKTIVGTVDVLTISNMRTSWDTSVEIPNAVRYHTVTWVDGNVNGFIVVGGQVSSGSLLQIGAPQLFSNGNWTSPNVAGAGGALTRYGHTVTNDGSGTLYLFGGMASPTSPASNEMYILDTTAKSWQWLKARETAPEARAFHAATLLPDKTILYTFGQTGADQSTATDTYMIFDIGAASWSKVMNISTIVNITVSPNYVPPPPPVPPKPNQSPNSNPNNPNQPPANGSNGGLGGSNTGVNIAMIAGICGGIVALLFLCIIAFLLFRRRKNRRNKQPEAYYMPGGPKKDMAIMYNNQDDEEEKAKHAKAFMIRKPPSVYVVDEQDPDQEIPHPHYKSGYYGDSGHSGRDSPSVAEYELSAAGSSSAAPSYSFNKRDKTLSTVSSLAERRRYVEEQQRHFIDGYENTYNSPPPFEPHSNEDRYQEEEYEEEEEPLPRNTRSNGRSNQQASSSSGTGPRYPRNNSDSGRRGGARSQYEHPADDYFQ
ncbi:hypothetical protein EDD11_006143 [Mortierella claussenii]|nr:hypothetical protein EDD11_006143 [Mortierella claussenii]